MVQYFQFVKYPAEGRGGRAKLNAMSELTRENGDGSA